MLILGFFPIEQLMYGTESALPFFSAVVKNVANTSLEVKKLVYIYLVHYAEAEPDLALLSINAIQKSLTDSNPQVRAMALRTMSGIRVPVISQIVSLAIKRGCADMSPHVRKTAALAIPKCYRLDPSTLPQLIGYLATLLGDNQYFVAGPAVAAFLEICPDRIDLIHKCYRSLVRKLVDMDEWSQISTLHLLTSYARQCFPQRTQKVKQKASKKDFYDDDESTHEGGEEGEGDELVVPALDPDLEFFLRTCRILLQNRNSAVIVSVVRAFLYLAPPNYLEAAVGPLVALLRSPQDIQHVALCNIVVVALRYPNLFTKYVSHFLVHSIDPPHIWQLKLEVLTLLFPHCGMHLKGIILSDLRHFAQGTDPELVRESVRAIGRCAQTDPDTADYCLDLLLGQVASLDDNLVSETLTVIRHLIQQDPASHEQTVIELVKHLGSTNNPDARATIVWLVGEFAGVNPERNIAPDVLRILVKGFADESEAAKQQIVLLGAKVYLHHLLRNPPPEPKVEPAPSEKVETLPTNEWADDQDESKSPENQENQENQVAEQPAEPEPDRITLLWQYLLLLTRYDTSYDLRDRARLYKALLANPSSTDLANLLLLAPKPVPYTPSPSETRKDLLIGSATLIVGSDVGVHGLRGYEDLPPWVQPGQEPDPNLREQEAKPELTEKLPSTAAEKLDRALREHQSSVAALDQQRRLGHGHGQAMASASKGKKTLDEWLEDESETEEETESEEETGSEEETDEEEETDSEEEGESEEESEEESDSDGNEEGAQLLQGGSGYAQSSKDVP